jgi:hypothetical protein
VRAPSGRIRMGQDGMTSLSQLALLSNAPSLSVNSLLLLSSTRGSS